MKDTCRSGLAPVGPGGPGSPSGDAFEWAGRRALGWVAKAACVAAFDDQRWGSLQVGAADTAPVSTAGGAGIQPDGYILVFISLVGAVVTLPLQSSIAGLMFAALAAVGLLRANWQALCILIFPVYGFAGALVSNMFIENGAYISEQGRAGQSNGATAVLAVYVIVFLLCAHAAIVVATRRYVGKLGLGSGAAPRMRRLLMLGILGTAAVEFTVVAIYGTAIDAGVERFEYWASMPDALAAAITNLRALNSPLAAGMGFYIVYFARRDSLLLASFGCAQVPLYLMGDKLSPFLGAGLYFVLGAALASLARGSSLRVSWRAVVGTLLACLALVLALAGGYRNAGSSDIERSIESRMVLQGHVWYGSHVAVRGGLDPIPAGEMVRPNSLGKPSGLDRLSYLVSSPGFVHDRIRRGVTFTLGGPASPYVVAGPVFGAALYGLLGLIYGVAAGAVLRMLEYRRFVAAFVALTFFLAAASVTVMGNWYSIYNSASLVFYATMVAVLVARSAVSRNPLRSRMGTEDPVAGTIPVRPSRTQPPTTRSPRTSS